MHSISKRSLGYAVVALAVALLGKPAPAEADRGCTLRSVRGDFGYEVTGTNLAVGLVSAVGRVNADGNGTLVGADTLSVSGTILRRQITGAYTLEEDCTGTVLFTDDLGQSTNLDFVLVDKGDELRFIQTDPDTIITGNARRL